MKHNKKRNTAFVFEILCRELTKALVEENIPKKNKIVEILKEHFTKGSPLAVELQLYKALLETQNIQVQIAERLLHEVCGAHAQLDERIIFEAQSQLISAINKNIGHEVWRTFIPNFKSLASVSALFSSKTNLKKKVLFEQNLIERMSKKETPQHAGDLQSVDSLTCNSFIKKFNDKYGGLLQEQKDLLNRYITSFTDDGLELRLYLNEELTRLKEALKVEGAESSESLVNEKTIDVVKYLESFRHRDLAEKDINKILQTQELVKELITND